MSPYSSVYFVVCLLQPNPLKLQIPFKETSSNDHTISVPSVYNLFFFTIASNLQWARASSFTRFLDNTQRRVTVGRIPLHEWPVRRRDAYLTTHNTYNRQTSMPPAGFEPTIPEIKRPQTLALECAATGIDDYGL